MKSWQYGLLVLGVLVCSIRPVDLLILNGNVLGEKTTGIGIVIWIVGIGILGLFVVTIQMGKPRDGEGQNLFDYRNYLRKCNALDIFAAFESRGFGGPNFN